MKTEIRFVNKHDGLQAVEIAGGKHQENITGCRVHRSKDEQMIRPSKSFLCFISGNSLNIFQFRIPVYYSVQEVGDF